MLEINKVGKKMIAPLDLDTHSNISPRSEALQTIFQSQIEESATLLDDPLPSFHQGKRIGLGAAGGIATAILTTTTGISTALHEVVGHGYLGLHATENYASGSGPSYQIDGWDNFRAIGHSGSFSEGVSNFLRWISGHDTYSDGSSGVTYHGNPLEPNALGQAMGQNGQSAWISICGSIPGLILDSSAVVGGMLLRHRSPILGNGMIAFGIADHLIHSSYAISAATMTADQMRAAAVTGHDFANFAIQMSEMTGISAEVLAVSTAVAWTTFVPLVAGLAYLHTQSEMTNIIPDIVALNHWIAKSQTDETIHAEIKTLLENYENIQVLGAILERISRSSNHLLSLEEVEWIQDEILDFINYLLEHVPHTTLNTSKQEILTNYEQNAPIDKIRKTLSIASLVGTGSTAAIKIINLLAATVLPSLQLTATTLTTASPLFAGISIISAGYQVYTDALAPDTTIPKAAKMISIARLVTTIASTVLIVVPMFVPGLNMLFISTLLFMCISNVLLSYARMRIIQKRFAYTQAMQPATRSLMEALWDNHQTQRPGTPMSRPLQRWVDCVSLL